MHRILLFLILLSPVQATAESLVATRMIRAASIIGPDDVTMGGTEAPGAATSLDDVLGMEARVAIYPGRPIRLADLSQAAVIERNQLVRMMYRSGPLTIESEGRALGRAAPGDTISVMNLSSRQTVHGVVTSSGIVDLSGPK
ncbi:MAG: flagellar basal body P-ring formation chaperone FlgA [Roseinatronobacter sp.]